MKFSTPIKQNIRRKLIAKKKSSRNKVMYLLVSVLTVLLIIGFFIYKGNKHSLKFAEKDRNSIKNILIGSETEKSENPLPAIKKAKLQFESINNIDKLKVIIEVKDDDKRGIKYNYEWFKNNEPFGGNVDSITGFKKGDKIDVKVTSFDEKQFGQPVMLSIEIGRVTPKIIENKEISFDGKLMFYQVKAVNPDGNALKYYLIDPPNGMTINNETGMINWTVKAEDYGKREIKVRIASSNGAEVVYPLSIDIGKVAE